MPEDWVVGVDGMTPGQTLVDHGATALVYHGSDGFTHIIRSVNGLEGITAKPIVVFPNGTVDYFDSAIIAGVADGVAKRLAETVPESNQTVMSLAVDLLTKHVDAIGGAVVDYFKDNLSLGMFPKVESELPISTRLRKFAETLPNNGYRRDVERLAYLAEREGR